MLYIKEMRKILNRNKFLSFLYITLTPAEAVTSVIFAYLIEPVTDAANQHNGSMFQQFIILIFLAAIANCVLAYVTAVISVKLVKEYEKNIRKDVFNNIMGQTNESFFKQNTNAYLSVLDVDVKTIAQNNISNVLSIYSLFWSFVFSICAVTYLDWKVAVLVMVFSLISVLIPRIFQKKLDEEMLSYSDGFSRLMERTKDCLDGFTILKVFRSKKHAANEFNIQNETVITHDIRKETLMNKIDYLSMSFTQMTFLGVILLGSIMVYYGNMKLGIVLALSQMIGGIVAPFERLPRSIAGIKSTKVLYKKISSIHASCEIDYEPVKVNEVNNILSLDHVHFSYEPDTVLFEDLSFAFDTSQKYVIVGDSGSGKSTLVKLLLKFYPVTQGQVSWNGRDISTIGEQQYYSLLSYQQQDTFLFDDTIEYNITLGRACSQEHLQEIVRKCGLEEMIASLELGIRTVVHENGNILSGGERQRIGIARSMVETPKMIILDEAFANLDYNLALQIEELVISMKDCGCIMITHQLHPSVLSKCDCVIYLEKGKIIKSGTFQEHFRN